MLSAATDQNRGSAAAWESEQGSPAATDDALPPVVDPLAVGLAPLGDVTSGGAPAACGDERGAAIGPRGVLDAALVAEVVQRVSWGGDRRRGVARLELGGELSGVVVVVEGEGRDIGLGISAPPGRNFDGLRERLEARLVARGLSVRELSVG